MSEAFPAVFEQLRAILEPYEARLHVAADEPGGYGLDMAPPSERNPTTWFAGARIWKRYVSYYLMPVYVEPWLLDGISPALRRRMQGKCCFNFTAVDATIFAELEGLTRLGYERTAGNPAWVSARRVEHGRIRRRSSADR